MRRLICALSETARKAAWINNLGNTYGRTEDVGGIGRVELEAAGRCDKVAAGAREDVDPPAAGARGPPGARGSPDGAAGGGGACCRPICELGTWPWRLKTPSQSLLFLKSSMMRFTPPKSMMPASRAAVR